MEVERLRCENRVWSTIEANKNNLTALKSLEAPPWVSESEFRGTMSILQSCVLTLLACIYTAIHLNVPEKKDWLNLLWKKLQWVLLALFAPEIVLYIAGMQFFDAWRVKRHLQELQKRSVKVDQEVS
jgi:hypothetical protein